MPGENLLSWAVAAKPQGLKLNELENLLRRAPVPVIGRIEGDRLLLDMRTIADEELDLLYDSMQSVFSPAIEKENKS
jgi:L-seryl-tRNA(Ser) seleniumtransferase